MQASFRFRHSLGNGPIGIVPLPSLRWEIKTASPWGKAAPPSEHKVRPYVHASLYSFRSAQEQLQG